jgi:cell wall-associated NlpC family hydrolase
MTTNSPLHGNSALMSPMTKSYVEAMIREGDSFDFDKWYERASKQMAEANRVFAASAASDAQVSDFRRTTTQPDTSKLPENGRKPVFALKQSTTRRSRLEPNADASSSFLKQQLEDICDAFDEFQERRDRDAVYGYLKAVFRIVVEAKRRGDTARLVRRAFKFAGLPYQEGADPFAVVIRSTCEHRLDDKTISKWARALRYAGYRSRPPRMLKSFIEKLGGINAAADRYAKRLGRGGNQKTA